MFSPHHRQAPRPAAPVPFSYLPAKLAEDFRPGPRAVSSPLPPACPTHSIGRSSNKKSLVHWRFDPVGDPAFHSSRFTDHELGLGSIQPLSFLSLADSCCTMDACNPFAFNRFGTLSIAMGGIPRRPSHSPLVPRCAPTETLLSLSLCSVTEPFFDNEGGTPHSVNFSPRLLAWSPSKGLAGEFRPGQRSLLLSSTGRGSPACPPLRAPDEAYESRLPRTSRGVRSQDAEFYIFLKEQISKGGRAQREAADIFLVRLVHVDDSPGDVTEK
jgi:hypothetical protein